MRHRVSYWQIIFALLFFPIVLMGSGQLGNILFSLLVVAFMLCFCNSKDWRFGSYQKLLLLPPVLIIIALLMSPEVSVRNSVEVVRPLMFFVFFCAGGQLLNEQGSVYFERSFRQFILVTFLLVICSVLFRDQFDNLELLYGKIDNAVSLRYFIPFANPYDLGLFMVLGFLLSMKDRNFKLMLICFIVIVFTQSRTAVILLVIASLIYSYATKRLFSLLKYTVPIISAIVIILLSTIEFESVKRFYIVGNTLGVLNGKSASLTKRIDQWELGNHMTFFGNGAVDSDEVLIENGVIYEVYKYGFFSILTLMLYYIIPLGLAINSILTRNWNSNDNNKLELCLAVWIICSCIGSLSNVFIYQPKLSVFYWLTVSYLASKYFFEQKLPRLNITS